MSIIKPRPPQTKVKHTILESYLNDWGGVIINGLRHQRDFHFVYVDCNASNGRFSGELEDTVSYKDVQTVWGSPIIGIQALDKHATWAREKAQIHVRTTSILFEKDRNTFEELKQSLLLAGLDHRVRETDNFFSLQDGEIAILHKDSTTMASKLIRYTQSGGNKFSFFVLDPYGPKGIPLPFVHEIIRQPKHDVLIYMPYLDLHKKSGLVPKAHRSSIDEKLLSNYNSMFGNEQWQDIVRDLDNDEIRIEQASLSTEAIHPEEAVRVGDLELVLVNFYKKALSSVDPGLVVKSIDLHFPDKDRTMYYLYLTTHDPTGALLLNKVLYAAGYQEYELRWKLMQARKLQGRLTLFDTTLFDAPAPTLQTSSRATIEEIGEHLLRLLQGNALTRRSLYTALADEPYFSDEIDKALRLLRKRKKVSFDGDLRHKTLIKIEHS